MDNSLNEQTPGIPRLPPPFNDLFLKSGEPKILEPQEMMYIRGGGVDPSCSLPNARIHEYGECKLTKTVVKVDINSGENIFHTFQILRRKFDDREEYNIFHSCGRIGEDKRWTVIEKNSHQDVCYYDYMNYCKEYLQDRSWTSIAVDCRYDNIYDSLPCNLDKPVKDLMKRIFDIDDNVIICFKIDLTKLPFGKLRECQYDEASKVLKELGVLIRNGQINSLGIVNLSNKYYALIPQRFSITGPELLDTEEKVDSEIVRLGTLRNNNFNYQFLDAGTLELFDKNPLDVLYEKLRTGIQIVDTSTDEFLDIRRYVSDSHGPTHLNYTLELCQVFRINRHGEEERYKQFENVENRTLLWHGTRVSSLISILQDGLMVQHAKGKNLFGRGLYFADRVSKAAKYTRTSGKDERLILLLCDVALGDMEELSEEKKDERLQDGKLSRKGLGRWIPNPEDNTRTPEGIVIPWGRSVDLKTQGFLDYNEYVTYDDAQVKIEYWVILAKNYIKQSWEI